MMMMMMVLVIMDMMLMMEGAEKSAGGNTTTLWVGGSGPCCGQSVQCKRTVRGILWWNEPSFRSWYSEERGLEHGRWHGIARTEAAGIAARLSRECDDGIGIGIAFGSVPSHLQLWFVTLGPNSAIGVRIARSPLLDRRDRTGAAAHPLGLY